MKKEYTILIADRNPHVREFLKREMTVAGYRVRLAENSRQVIKWAFHYEPVDLLILDPDLPDTEESSLLINLQDRVPPLPVVFHTFLSNYDEASAILKSADFVEKQGNSVESLKQIVCNILQSPIARSAQPADQE